MTQYLEITRNTRLKMDPVQTSALTNQELSLRTRPVNVGERFRLESYANTSNGHILVKLETPLSASPMNVGTGYHNWYVWHGHAKIVDELVTGLAVLDVPFFPQTDNLQQPHRTCNSSVHAMLVEYLKPASLQPNGKQKEDDVYWLNLTRFGDTTNHDAHTRLLGESYGIKSRWSHTLSYGDLDRQLANGLPVPMGILHRGSLDQPTGGHIILCIGQHESGGYIFHDPYGSLLDGYQSDVTNGRSVVYGLRQLNARWLDRGRAKTGWGRIVEKF